MACSHPGKVKAELYIPNMPMVQEDLTGAVAFAKAEIRRLLQGQVTVAELAMTGGLWRITGKQVPSPAWIL